PQTFADPTPVDITVVEPHATIAKSIVGAASGLQAGDTVQYQIVLANPSAQGATSTAFDTLLQDALPAGVLVTSIDAVVLAGGAPNILGDGSLNDYRALASAAAAAAQTLTLDKSVIGPATRTIGDRVNYQIVLGVFQGVTQNLAVTDVLPADLDYIAGTLAVA